MSFCPFEKVPIRVSSNVMRLSFISLSAILVNIFAQYRSCMCNIFIIYKNEIKVNKKQKKMRYKYYRRVYLHLLNYVLKYY